MMQRKLNFSCEKTRQNWRPMPRQIPRHRRRSAFTLVEILVALSIFLVMLTIIFVPLNLGLNLFSIGKTRADVLQAAQGTLDRMEGELRKALVVFPNAAMPGVTYTVDSMGNKIPKAPYGPTTAINPEGHPYLRVYDSGYGVCDANDPTKAEYVDNTHRLDFLLPDTFDVYTKEEQVQAVMPLRPAPYLVSYYYRRQNTSVSADAFDNPITLYRAQMPYRQHDPNVIIYDANYSNGRNVNLLPFPQNGDSSRYPDPADTTACGANKSKTNQGSFWLKQLYVPADPMIGPLNESNLEPLTKSKDILGAAPAPTPLPEITRSHDTMLPKGVALITRNAFPDPTAMPPALPNYTPDTTFQCADTNNDGKIDQVTITLVLGSFDDNSADRSNSQSSDRAKDSATANSGINSQRIRQTRIITLGNVR